MPVPPPSYRDDDLVRALRGGDAVAFEQLYADHHVAIYNLCARVLCDREEAQDVTQDVFIKAFVDPPAADERLNLRGWLYRVATNACYSALRRRGRQGGDGDLEAVGAPVDEYERAHTAGLVEQSLEKMSDRYRTALVLKDLHGLAPAEIAAVLQISRPAADVLVHRARAAFRSAFSRLAGGASAPASLGMALVPLAVPAALQGPPPLPAGVAPGLPHVPAPPHATTPPGPAAPAPVTPLPHTHVPSALDPSSLAGPGAAGLLSRLGDSLAAKAAATAAAATLLVGGGVAIEHADRDGGRDGGAAAAATVHRTPARQAGSWWHEAGGDSLSRWDGHHHTLGEAAGHDTAHHDTHAGSHDGTSHVADGAMHDSTGTHGGGTSTTGGDHDTSGTGGTRDTTGTSGGTHESGDTSHDGGTATSGGGTHE